MDSEFEFPEPLASVLRACEVNCIAGCCGLDAFDIHPQWIRVWMESHDPALLEIARQQIEEMIGNFAETEGEYDSLLLNHRGNSTYWVSLLTRWKEAIEKAPDTPLPAPPQPETSAQRFKSKLYECLVLFGCSVLGAAPIVAIIFLIYWLMGRL